MARRASIALRSPSRASSSSRVRRAATSENSAATKKAFANTRPRMASRPQPETDGAVASMARKVSHSHSPEREAVSRRLIIVLVLTSVFMVVEAIGGWVSGALALLADAAHMGIDVGALGLSAFTAWLARKP